MRLYNTQHPFYCGIDLHARAMYVCILTQAGETLRHRHMQTTPAAFLAVVDASSSPLLISGGRPNAGAHLLLEAGAERTL